jgi:transcription antitermination factor NusG
MDSDVRWHAIRVTYSREMKFQASLQEAGFETFIPMCRKNVQRNGKQLKVLAPAVANLCFVKASYLKLRSFMEGFGEANPARFMWDKSTRKPIVVPDKAMEDFIKISLTMSDEILFLKEVSQKLREGQKVRIVDGPFKGVEGTVVRIKKSRRVMVELPGMLAVTTNYIPLQELEIL